MESLPDLNVAINPCKFHHSTIKIVVRKFSQTDKQTTNRGENNTPAQNFVLAEVMIIIITRGALSRAQVSPPGSVDHRSGSALYR